MDLEISHKTRFDYDREVEPKLHLVFLRPRENPLLEVRDFRLEFTPAAEVQWMRDDLDNLPATIRFLSPARVVEIQSRFSVVTSDAPPFEFLVRDYARSFPFVYEPLHSFNLGIYLLPPAPSTQKLLKSWLEQRLATQPGDTVAWLFELSRLLFKSIAYERRDAPGIRDSATTLALGTGACRDLAVLFVEIARTYGLAARFVSGYLFDVTRPGEGGDMHAWAEVFLPGAGWRGVDPTHGIFCDNVYVPVAHAVVAESVSPVQGSYFSQVPAQARLTAEVSVRRR